MSDNNRFTMIPAVAIGGICKACKTVQKIVVFQRPTSKSPAPQPGTALIDIVVVLSEHNNPDIGSRCLCSGQKPHKLLLGPLTYPELS